MGHSCADRRQISKHIFAFDLTSYKRAAISGGLEGRPRRAPPPLAQNVFNFMQFCEKFCKILCWCPPPLQDWRPHLRRILDPPLPTLLMALIYLFKSSLLLKRQDNWNLNISILLFTIPRIRKLFMLKNMWIENNLTGRWTVSCNR